MSISLKDQQAYQQPFASIFSQTGARFASGLPLAAIITIGLFLLMRSATYMGVVVLSDIEKWQMPPLSPTVEELEPIIRTEPELMAKVTPPPQMPKIEKQIAQQPGEPIANMFGALPNIGDTNLLSTVNNYFPVDRDEQPIVRPHPFYPPNLLAANKQGDCKVSFDVSANGVPNNILAKCDPAGFERSARRAVAKWRYNPKIVDGQPVERLAVQNVIRFRIAK